MKQEEKEKLAGQIAYKMASGVMPDGETMATLIKGLCEEYKQERQGRVSPCRAHDLEGNQ